MNICILNCSNTFNYGSMMMGENFIYYFNKVTGTTHHYYVETSDEVNIQRLRHSTGIEEVYSIPENSLFKSGLNKYDYILSYCKMKKTVSELAKKMHLIVVLGGDDFTEDYGWKGPLIRVMQFNILRNEGLKIVMLGQTIGPYLSFRKPAMKMLLKRVDKIYPREPLSYNFLKNLGLKNISMTDDLALLPLAKQEAPENIKEYITYCPSELIYRYSKEGSREEWIEFNLFMIDTVMKKFRDKKLVLLAHVLKPEHVDDRIIVGELYDRISSKYPDRIIVEKRELYPYQVREYIQQSFLVISGRMHPVISAIQCEVPAISISYSSKYWGIIGERFGLGDFILDVRQLNYRQMKERFIHLMERIELEYSAVQEKMRVNGKSAEENIFDTLKEIYCFL